VARELHPAENRGYRELYAIARQIARHWSALAERLEGSDAAGPLEAGAKVAERLIDELEQTMAEYGLPGWPGAQGVGSTLATVRTEVRDRFLERNQAVRLAWLDAQHATTLLAYLASVAATREDEGLADFCRGWERRIRRAQTPVRSAAIDMGTDPDAAIAALDESPAGRIAHGASYAFGALGEWTDRRAAAKRRG
jgi:hypothetical protein